VIVRRATAADDELVDAVARLLPQLSPEARVPTRDELAEVVATQTLLVARDADGTIVGTLTLALYRIPTGLKAVIEDVVVDEAARGQGVGEALTREAVEEARRAGADRIALTSQPQREAANRLYRRLGFEQRETNVYRLVL
jgi:ribosomal protein S18 acetylase RimI-like enzyme